jgi:hypothetical protein
MSLKIDQHRFVHVSSRMRGLIQVKISLQTIFKMKKVTIFWFLTEGCSAALTAPDAGVSNPEAPATAIPRTMPGNSWQAP